MKKFNCSILFDFHGTFQRVIFSDSILPKISIVEKIPKTDQKHVYLIVYSSHGKEKPFQRPSQGGWVTYHSHYLLLYSNLKIFNLGNNMISEISNHMTDGHKTQSIYISYFLSNRAGHLRYFLMFSIIKNYFIAFLNQINNLYLHQYI